MKYYIIIDIIIAVVIYFIIIIIINLSGRYFSHYSIVIELGVFRNSHYLFLILIIVNKYKNKNLSNMILNKFIFYDNFKSSRIGVGH